MILNCQPPPRPPSPGPGPPPPPFVLVLVLTPPLAYGKIGLRKNRKKKQTMMMMMMMTKMGKRSQRRRWNRRINQNWDLSSLVIQVLYWFIISVIIMIKVRALKWLEGCYCFIVIAFYLKVFWYRFALNLITADHWHLITSGRSIIQFESF